MNTKNQEILIYHAQYIKALDNLSNLNPSSCILANARKLTNVEIHSTELYNINVTNNTFLRSINLEGCSALGTVTATGSSLDLSNCKYLRYCNVYNTALTEVQLNTSGGSLIEILYPKTIQSINLIKQRLLEKIGLPYGSGGDEIPTSLYTISIEECPSIKYLNTSDNSAINTSFASMVYCNNLTIRNSLDLRRLTFDGFYRLKKVVIENMYNLEELGFNDLLPKGDASTLQYIGLSNCPLLEVLELNCTSNEYEITFANKAILNLGGLFGLKSIESNCVLKGIETIVVPLNLESMFFTNEYGEGYSTIKNIWSSSVCTVNTSGSTAKAQHIDPTYEGIDFAGMNLKNIDLGALVNIPKAINFTLHPTTVNPHFNLNRDGETYPYLQPVGTLDLSNYTESLAKFFDGVDLDKLKIVCNNKLPQTDLSYCFYNATFSNDTAINTLLSKVSSITNLDYCFYKTTVANTSILSKISMGESSTMNYTFAECPNITNLKNVIIPSSVIEIEGMFYKCPLTAITNMIVNVNGSISGLFKGCTELTTISTLRIPNVTDVSSTFEGCTSLTTLTGFELPSSCTNVSNLFNGCYMLTSISMNFGSNILAGENWYPPNLETLNDTNIESGYVKMTNCSTLKNVNNLYINNGDYSDMFNGCPNLATLTLTMGTNITGLARFIKGCSKITSKPFTEIPETCITIEEMFNGTNITDISGMIFGSKITNATNWLPIGLITANNVTIKNNMVKFNGCSTLVNCNNLTITNNVNNLSFMFNNCTKLANFYLSDSCDLSKVTTTESMFYSCYALTEIDFKNLNISSMKNMLDFFRGSNNFTMKNFRLTSNSCNYVRAFYYPYYFENIYIGNNNAVKAFGRDTSMYRSQVKTITGLSFGESVTDISEMFKDCPNLTYDFIIPSTITDCSKCFYGCTKITHIHSNWDNNYTNEITATDCYAGCTGITHIDNIKVVDYEGDLGLDYIPETWGGNGFDRLTWSIQIDASLLSGGVLTLPETASKVNWGDGNADSNIKTHTYTDTTRRYNIKFKVKDYIANDNYNYDNCRFENSTWLTKVYQVPAKKGGANIGLSFRLCENLEYVNFSNLEITRSISSLLAECKKLTTENIIGLENAFKANYNCPTNFEHGVSYVWHAIFSGCAGLNSLDFDMIGKYTGKCTDMSNMFYGCSNLTSLDLSSWDVSKVTSLSNMFKRCPGITSLDLSGWDTSSLRTMTDMFYGCSNLQKILGIEDFNISQVTNLSGVFRECAMTSINLDSWDFNGVTKVSYMFYGSKIQTIDTTNWDVSTITWFDDFCNMSLVKYIALTFSGSMWMTMHRCVNVEQVIWRNCSVVIDNYSFHSYLDRNAKWQITFDNAVITSAPGTVGVLDSDSHLTVESLVSILNALEDKTGTSSETLRIGSQNLAKLNSSQIAIATNKNWTLV